LRFFRFGRPERVPKPSRLVVGLGNPGAKYEDTRHNAGFRVVEALAAAEKIRIRTARASRARIGQGTVEGVDVLIAMPTTYMNASGEAVSALCNLNGIDSPAVLVVSDDIDLPLGTLRMRAKGSAGGQKGIASIVSALGTSEFPRLRVGIRGERYSRESVPDLADYVLAPFEDEGDERAVFEDAVVRAVDGIRVWLADGIDAAMRHVNSVPGALSANDKPSSPAPASEPD
jgi:PTH1 family peptidyl-tRNA hydrolase